MIRHSTKEGKEKGRKGKRSKGGLPHCLKMIWRLPLQHSRCRIELDKKRGRNLGVRGIRIRATTYFFGRKMLG